MLTPGNLKLGGRRIWGFALPSGRPDLCPGMSATCRAHCYAVALERYRPAAAARYRRNLLASHRRDFTRQIIAFLVAHRVQVVRIHTGGEFYSVKYARKWLRVIRRSQRVRFFFYSRCWRIPAIKAVIDRMAGQPNCVAWYSCDRDTGVPAGIPAGVRVAWLSISDDDVPAAGIDLVFRIRRLRRRPTPTGGTRVCPAEDGVQRPQHTTCDTCTRCWRRGRAVDRIPLPVIEESGGRDDTQTSP